MIDTLWALILLALLLFSSACSTKRTKIVLKESNLTTFTEGDYELTQVANTLAEDLDIPLHRQNELLKQNLPLDEVTFVKVDHALCLILNGKIFQKNRATPIENAHYIIQDIANVIKQYPHLIIQVTGHTDSHEENTKHQDLSDNRAISIAEILYKLDAKNETYAKGCGDKKPLFFSTDKEDTLSNARVEIYIYANKAKMIDRCK